MKVDHPMYDLIGELGELVGGLIGARYGACSICQGRS
jgi:hypothetical protein